ncbi:MAG: hypothetical protein OXN88_04310 [Chloroflexota bacterium]|nr:hypothetical protein [Chloroflexota bacterium]
MTETANQLRGGQAGDQSVVLKAGQKSVIHPVLTEPDDSRVENSSEVTATITAGAGYSVGDPAADALWVRDDDVPAVSVSAGPAVTEGQDAVFTVHASQAPITTDLTVRVAVAQTGQYVATSGLGARNITIPRGDTTARLAVPTIDDATAEQPGAVTATVTTAGAGYSVGQPAAASVAVNDNEPAVTITADTHTITEGANATFTIHADPAPTAAITVTATVAQTGQHAATSALGNRNITIPKGSRTATLAVATVDDTTAEDPGTVTVTITATGTARTHTVGTPATATVAVEDNDRTITITAGAAVTEGQPATFTIHADPAPAADTRITVQLKQDGDFLVPRQKRTNLVKLPAGAATTTYEVATVDDPKDEPNGSITATVTAAPGYKTGTPATATVTINDNDEVLLGIRGLGIACNSGRGLIEGASTNFCVFNSARNRASVDIDYTIYLTYNPYGRLLPWQEGLNKAAASTSCVVQGTDVVLLDWIDGTFGEDAEWDDAIKGSGALRGTIPAGSLISLAWDVEVCDDTVVEGRERIGLVVRLEAAGRTRTFPNSPVYVRDND